MRETLVKTEEFKDSPLGKIPKDWGVLKIATFASIKYGINDAIDQTLESGIPTITLPCVKSSGELVLDKEVLGLTSRHKVYPDDVLQHGDLLFNWRNGSQDHLGKTAYFKASGEYTHVGFLLRIRTNPEMCNSRYLWWRLCYMKAQVFFLKAKSQVNNTFNSAELAAVNVIIPPVHEQQCIVEILDAVDEAIAHTSSLIAKLKQMKAGLLHDLLTRGLDENGELRDAIAHPEQFKDSPLGRIPKDWNVVTIGEACLLVKDGAHLPPKRVENGPLLLSVQNIINSRLQWSDSDTRISWDFYKSMHRNWEIQVGDVLLTIIGTIGRTAIVPPMPPFTLQRNVAVLRCKTSILDNLFLHHYLASEFFQKMVVGRGNQTAQPAIFLSDINLLKIPLPSLKEQKKITTVVEEYNTRIRTEEAYRDKLKLQKQGLMHDLLTGKVRVKNA